jgi:hypothetical protein
MKNDEIRMTNKGQSDDGEWERAVRRCFRIVRPAELLVVAGASSFAIAV